MYGYHSITYCPGTNLIFVLRHGTIYAVDGATLVRFDRLQLPAGSVLSVQCSEDGNKLFVATGEEYEENNEIKYKVIKLIAYKVCSHQTHSLQGM